MPFVVSCCRPRFCAVRLQDHKGGGIVHFRTRDDMEYALRKLDGSDFRNPFEKSRISVSRRCWDVMHAVSSLFFSCAGFLLQLVLFVSQDVGCASRSCPVSSLRTDSRLSCPPPLPPNLRNTNRSFPTEVSAGVATPAAARARLGAAGGLAPPQALAPGPGAFAVDAVDALLPGTHDKERHNRCLQRVWAIRV